ncbi:Mrn1p NDAI_0F02260 [Naumovozyma dairenensis CBS 421]|uniref:RRM domain-containing protein n=1 Tax=Naumovozyma dairenensis (strain ATCC 10597 / BCRC 20456 / CBS 421 / NBRC 0211 / NRRL Y-12639) TaxID=1071378 RepID=G0WCN3_NAUDC|nr:hypothetical protein NDAI_0F02260 [Naumovozyma dairenensis CBS 421]CCD25544.1 hypothetical protein NDAI_0F02260 [Naumovozyma dairenensis CBS 421]
MVFHSAPYFEEGVPYSNNGNQYQFEPTTTFTSIDQHNLYRGNEEDVATLGIEEDESRLWLGGSSYPVNSQYINDGRNGHIYSAAPLHYTEPMMATNNSGMNSKYIDNEFEQQNHYPIISQEPENYHSLPVSISPYLPQSRFQQQQQHHHQQQQQENGYYNNNNNSFGRGPTPMLSNMPSMVPTVENMVTATAAAVANANTRMQSTMGSRLNDPLDFTTAPSRTVYLGNIPSDLTVKELLDHVRSGVIEDVKIIPEKLCAFISFLDENSALLFHSDAILKRLNINGKDIKIGWGKSTAVDPMIATRIINDGATRNVFIGQLKTKSFDPNKAKVTKMPPSRNHDINATISNENDEKENGVDTAHVEGEVEVGEEEEPISDAKLRKDLADFGDIDCIKIVEDKGIAFIHFASITSAIKCVHNLNSMNDYYSTKKIFYGKDRCAFITKTQQHNAAQFLGIQSGMKNLIEFSDRNVISNALLQQSAAAAAIATSAGGPNNLGNRTIYLGNLPKDIRVEEICNVVRGGLLQSVKLLGDRYVCFVTFIDPTAAAQFFAMSSLHGLTIQKKRCKVGWGKHSGPLSNALALAVSHGASRNIYIGNIDFATDKKRDNPIFTEDSLRKMFSMYGEMEQINFLPEKNCCFINFTNISNAILALDKIKSNPVFKDLKINFGKDRCGNIPHQVR